MKMNPFFLIISILILQIQCYAKQNNTAHQSTINQKESRPNNEQVSVGAEQFSAYKTLIQNQRLALVVNQTSMVKNQHLVDFLLKEKQTIQAIFAPEHGFRGKADAGEKIDNTIDYTTQIPIISLYGKHKKPTVDDLKNVDVVIFDIQDVGARFYTYISTLHYVMEACAENNKKLIVLDRPNPNARYIDGPVLDTAFRSFVGMHPIPVLHAMTIAEYALMINGEKWLQNGIQCNLEVVKCIDYDRNQSYHLPIKPSPNLPNDVAIQWYPSLCFFEGTQVSVGRGTSLPFQVYGSPYVDASQTTFQFTPTATEGAKHPFLEGEKCFGFDLRNEQAPQRLQLDKLIEMYQLSIDKENFFLKNNFFDLLAGNDQLRKDIIQGLSAEKIYASWQKDVEAFKKIRANYLLYP